MPRIRTIKPEIWTDEKFGPLDQLSKLVFIGLISQADDAGRLLDSVRLIDGLLFPYDDSTSARRGLDELSRRGLIERGKTKSGQAVIQIKGWASHQKIDRPNLDAALPPIFHPPNDSGGFDEDSTKPRRSLEGDSSARSTIVTSDPRSTIDDRVGTREEEPTAAPEEPTPTDELDAYLGDHRTVLDDASFLRTAKSRRLFFQAFGPPGMDASAWRRPSGDRVPESDRPQVLAAAINAYACEGKGRLVTNEFRGLLRRMISEPAGATPDHWGASL